MNTRLTLFTLLFVLSRFLLQAQNYEVKYQRYSNGKLDSSFNFILRYANQLAYLSDEEDENREFIDFQRAVMLDLMSFDGVLYKTVLLFSELPEPEITDEKEDILGFTCTKAVYMAFSNTIEVWFTDETEAKGSPYKRYFPENSLAMKIVINGNRSLVVTEILEVEEAFKLSYPFDKATEIRVAQARELQIESRYTHVPVFHKQQINFGDEIINPEFGLTDTTYRFSKGTVILKKIKLPKINKKGGSIYATVTNWSNGDAYDRTASLFTIPVKKEESMLDAFQEGVEVLPVFQDNKGQKYQGIISTKAYEVPVELMRFFTSFGVSHFNKLREINNYNWQDSVVYKQEISSLIPSRDDEIWIGIFIGNYDKGGHKVSLDLQFYPPWGDETPPKKWIEPLFSTVNIMEMSGQNYGKLFKNDTLSLDFYLPDSINDLQLLFTTTGHGGWGGGDEFNPKMNQVYIDGKLVFSHIPWRTDCATYRMSNPASGNFENGLSSSDLSRSNWCPATLTPPYFISLEDIDPGKHTIQVVIDQGEDEGSSFSHWSVTGVLTGYVQPKK